MAKPKRVFGLTPEMEFREAAGRIIATKYAEMVRFTEAAVSGHDADAVHDMRVSCKRLREAVSVLRVAFARARVRSVRTDVEALNDGMGAVRESDVFLQWLSATEPAVVHDEAAIRTLQAVRQVTEAERHVQLTELEALFADLLPDQLEADIGKLSGKRILREAMSDG
jgi:CHAD domain-containing protein